MDGFTLFLTGMQRSGTTLLERLVGLHPHASILAQPFPLIFVEAKRDFLLGFGRSRVRYPLGHLFLEDEYRQEDFDRYLAKLQINGVRLRQIFDEMRDFSGQYTRFDRSAVERAIPVLPAAAGFAELLAALYRSLSPEPEAPIVGGKETICEEFLPHFLDRGWRCVLILRDPRDVVASLNHGRGPEYGGPLKTTLFNVRNWRKSVAYALHLDGHPGFLWLRYEDLVADPRTTLHRIAHNLGLADFVPGEIRDVAGRFWTGNSSHGERLGVSDASVGAYQQILPEAVVQFVEAACLPELRFLGYPTSLDAEEAPGVLHGFEEPYEITREGIENDLAGDANAALESRRLELLGEAPAAATQPWFLFERAHARLREALLG